MCIVVYVLRLYNNNRLECHKNQSIVHLKIDLCHILLVEESSVTNKILLIPFFFFLNLQVTRGSVDLGKILIRTGCCLYDTGLIV